MATNNNLFDSLIDLLSHCFESKEDLTSERKEQLKTKCIEQIQEDRRISCKHSTNF